MSPFRPRPARSVRPLARRWPRSAAPWWAATILLAGLTAATVHGVLARAADAQARWRTTRTVLVATRRLAIGDRLAGAVERRRLPVAAIPDHAAPSVRGRVAMAGIGRGEVVTTDRLSGEAAAGATALLPPGSRAVVIPLAVTGLPVQAGDRVDLLAAADPSPAEVAVTGAAVAHGVLVVSSSAKALVVALPVGAVERVARALGQGSLIPALVGPAG